MIGPNVCRCGEYVMETPVAVHRLPKRYIWDQPELTGRLAIFIFHFSYVRFQVQDTRKHKFFNRSSSLKQSTNTTTTQPSVDLIVSGQTTTVGATHQVNQHHSHQVQQQQQPSTPKKSNWEVIEHFNTSAKGGKAVVSSSLIAVRINQFFVCLRLTDHITENYKTINQ